MLSVIGAFAEFKRALIHKRQREGIALAIQRGANKGRKKSLSEAALAELHQRLGTGVSKGQIAREFGISRESLYQHLRMAKSSIQLGMKGILSELEQEMIIPNIYPTAILQYSMQIDNFGSIYV